MKNAKYILSSLTALLIVATSILTTACDRNENDVAPFGQQPGGTGNGNENALRIVTSKQPFMDETGTRAVTDETYTTHFQDGDQIGIIAVKDGAVLEECNNLCLTYNSSTKNAWTGDDIFYVNGATYIAYSPYRATVMEGKTSAQQILDAFVINTNQQTIANYIANDLMIDDSGTIDRDSKSLTFSFEHKLALLEIPTKYEQMYARTTEGWVYPIKSGKLRNNQMRINNVLTTFLKNGVVQNAYVCLLKPGTNIEIKLGYAITSKGGISNNVEYILTNNTFVAGQRRKIFPTKTRDLAAGDYYYDDGSIFPGNITISDAPYTKNEGCIGVVFGFNNPSSSVCDELSDYSGTGLTGIHGYAMALDDASQPTIWSSFDGPDGRFGGDSFRGYYYTYYMINDSREGVAAEKAVNYPVSTPASCSGWYLPGYWQWAEFIDNQSIVKTAIQRAGGTALYYNQWSSCWRSSSETLDREKAVYYYNETNGMMLGKYNAAAAVRSCLTF